jgi:hypothetical protein
MSYRTDERRATSRIAPPRAHIWKEKVPRGWHIDNGETCYKMRSMSAFPDWEKFAVKQKRLETGCIPTGYEMILRAAGVANVDFATFQDDFDLDKDRKPEQNFQNNFDSVAKAVSAKYPEIHFEKRTFAKGSGAEKLAVIEGMIAHGKPVLISLALKPFRTDGLGGYHIMPVVDATADSLTLLSYIDENGKADTRLLQKSLFIQVHNNFDGGDDIAFLADAAPI